MGLVQLAKQMVSLTARKIITRSSRHTYRGYSYERIMPRANLSPWLDDKEFLEIYNKIKDHTLVDIYRCFEIWQLVEQCSKLNGALVEIGVWKGGTAALICHQTMKSNPLQQVYLADTFYGVVKAGGNDSYYKGGEHSDTSQEIVENLLSETLKLKNFNILKGIFPDETSHLIEHSTFSFVHVDVDVYNSGKDIVEWIWDKLVVGGAIVFDDYGFENCEGITTLVEEQRLENDRLVLHNLNGHAIIIKFM